MDASNLSVLALVTARGGSKGIPDKNLKPLCGYPLVAWAVAAGVQSNLVTRTICSTDSEEIGAVAQRYGAEVPFMRPHSLAEDSTPDLPVFLHALDHLATEESWVPDLIVHLRPTAPLRPQGLVDRSIELLAMHPEATSVRAVCEAPTNPYKMWSIPPKANPADVCPMIPLLDYPAIPEPYNAPRQALPKAYWQIGTVDTTRATTLRGGSMTGQSVLPLLVGSDLAVDIDRPSDLTRAAEGLRNDCVLPGPLPNWGSVEMLVVDVDGTLTPGEIYYGPDGELLKRFHTHDGRGIEMIQQMGIKVAIITQESSPFTAARAKKLRIDEVHTSATDKVAVLHDICRRKGIGLDAVAYVGDDLGDHAALTAVSLAGGLPCAVADARPEILKIAQFVTAKKGGFGAVRDVCDQILLAVARK